MSKFQEAVRKHFLAKAKKSNWNSSQNFYDSSTNANDYSGRRSSWMSSFGKKKKKCSTPSQDSIDLKLEEYMMSSVRESSKKSYASYWERYNSFCRSNGLSVDSKSVSAFLIHLAENSDGKSASLLARSAIKFFFKIKYPIKKSPTDTWLVSRISGSIKKKYGRPVKKARCLDSSIVKCLVMKLLRGKLVTLRKRRLACFIILQFFILGRYDDIANLKLENIVTLESGDLEIVVGKAKNIKNWDAKASSLANNPGAYYNPVGFIKEYLIQLKELSPSNQLLFPSLKSSKEGLIVLKYPISYDAILKEFRQILDQCGYDGKSFSLHSAKTGAASQAANSGLCSEEELRRHGRWKSSGMTSYYHKQSLAKKLAVSKALNICV